MYSILYLGGPQDWLGINLSLEESIGTRKRSAHARPWDLLPVFRMAQRYPACSVAGAGEACFIKITVSFAISSKLTTQACREMNWLQRMVLTTFAWTIYSPCPLSVALLPYATPPALRYAARPALRRCPSHATSPLPDPMPPRRPTCSPLPPIPCATRRAPVASDATTPHPPLCPHASYVTPPLPPRRGGYYAAANAAAVHASPTLIHALRLAPVSCSLALIVTTTAHPSLVHLTAVVLIHPPPRSFTPPQSGLPPWSSSRLVLSAAAILIHTSSTPPPSRSRVLMRAPPLSSPPPPSRPSMPPYRLYLQGKSLCAWNSSSGGQTIFDPSIQEWSDRSHFLGTPSYGGVFVIFLLLHYMLLAARAGVPSCIRQVHGDMRKGKHAKSQVCEVCGEFSWSLRQAKMKEGKMDVAPAIQSNSMCEDQTSARPTLAELRLLPAECIAREGNLQNSRSVATESLLCVLTRLSTPRALPDKVTRIWSLRAHTRPTCKIPSQHGFEAAQNQFTSNYLIPSNASKCNDALSENWILLLQRFKYRVEVLGYDPGIETPGYELLVALTPTAERRELPEPESGEVKPKSVPEIEVELDNMYNNFKWM
ncbi:hypothetical protein DFH08DRAFT_946390 [Mycena albidolilacea]|uniref:Uncharacterized protein n=1 Tax=Mycena albidolilacea TaxID=1033008 RepID=A0AAD6YW71_9AGAR|nr:hypothetical protein DFH08DRAFT_946390 [Mycena albidolilacea]